MLVELENKIVDFCPLCGEESKLHTDKTDRGDPYFWVKCDNLSCRCTTMAFDSAEKALTAWNQRAVSKVKRKAS